MNIIFMGSANFSVPALEAIIDSQHRLVGVITNPEKPAGRGLKNKLTKVAEIALQHNIDTITPGTLKNNNEAVVWIKQRKPDAIVVVAYGKIIPAEILSIPVYGCLNIHPSLLPKYRGAAPIQRAIMNNETRTGVTVMLLDEGMDSGPILMQSEVQILLEDDAVVLGERLSRLGADMLLKTLDLIEKKAIEPTPQQHELATFAPKVDKQEAKLDFSRSSIELHNIVRALIEWPTAWTHFRGEMIHVLKTEPLIRRVDEQPGSIINIDKYGIHVATGAGVLIIKSVRPASGKVMDALSYANGRHINVGELMG
ncbi:MAG: methionyl-tRNA formyltransferase [bacterium]